MPQIRTTHQVCFKLFFLRRNILYHFVVTCKPSTECLEVDNIRKFIRGSAKMIFEIGLYFATQLRVVFTTQSVYAIHYAH